MTPEGFVIRRPGEFSSNAFSENIAKYVRSNHIQTDDAWKRKWRKAKLGPLLQLRPVRVVACSSVLAARLTNARERHKVTTVALGEVELQRNFSFILEELAVSSTPTRREQIIAMSELGVALVVTLTEETPLPAEWFTGTGVENIFIPVTNYHPPTLPQVDEIFRVASPVIASGRKVMVHCGGGKGRAGTVAACFLLRYGRERIADVIRQETAGACLQGVWMQSDEVISHLRDMRPGSVETEHQERFIRDFASVLWRRKAEGLIGTVPADGDDKSGAIWTASGADSGNLIRAASSNAGEDHRISVSNGACGGSKCKREEKEAEKRLRNVQKRAPKYLLMTGFAGSGKSTFCAALETTGAWVRASQDDLGRKRCEELVRQTVPQVRQGKVRLVIDRCNLTASEREEWLNLMGDPPLKEVVCVFFDFPADVCKQRAAGRFDHPTIRCGGGGRIIDDQARMLERPHANEKGLGAVEIVRNFADAEALLRRYGATPAELPKASGALAASSTQDWDSVAEGTTTASEAAKDVAIATCDKEGSPRAVSDINGGGEPSPMLPAEFGLWLQTAVLEELQESDAEGLLAAVEVILLGAAEDPDAADSAAEVLRDGGAPRCAEALGARWQTTGGRYGDGAHG